MIRLLSMGLFLTSLSALAGGTATLEFEGQGAAGSMTMGWQDADNVRVDPDGQPAYMILRNGKAYSVANTGGQTMVMDLSSMAEMTRGAGGMGQPPGGGAPDIATARSVDRLEGTGRAETVAGIEGEVYTVAWTDNQGQTHENEAVLTDHALAVEMTAAFGSFAESMAAVGGDGSPTDAIKKALNAEGLGVLRFGDELRVAKLSDETPSDDALELPAEPMDMGELMKRMQDGFKNR